MEKANYRLFILGGEEKHSMKKRIIPIAFFVVSFAVAYLIICYLPTMRIKLSAEPLEYFIESIKHNMEYKAIISTIVGAFVGIISFLFVRRTK